MQTLDPAQWAGIPHICPDFVIELLAHWESRESVERKITTWTENGTKLAWLIDPYRRIVDIHAPHTAITRASELVIRGSGLVDGLNLDLGEIWRCYELEPAER